MTRNVVVLPYDPRWHIAYLLEADNLLAILEPEVLSMHHIGSTAIPGIKAKPTIDILLEVKCIERIDSYSSQMAASGLQPKGEFGIPGRRFFVISDGEDHTHHVHIFQTGSPQISRHLNFRDYLLRHSNEAQAYSRLKEELAERFPEDIEQYCRGKDGMVKEIDGKAGAWFDHLQEKKHAKTAI